MMRTRVTVDQQRNMGILRQQAPAANFVPADRMEILPSRHEVIDPYSHSPALQQAQHVTRWEYNPQSRAAAMLIKTSAVTAALAVLTLAAMFMLEQWTFLAWLLLASIEWVICFLALALLDWWETPSAHTRQLTKGYLRLMEREQNARLRRLYGDDGKE